MYMYTLATLAQLADASWRIVDLMNENGLHLLTSRISSTPTFAFGKFVPSGLKMGAEHSKI